MSEDQPRELFTNSQVDLTRLPQAETLGIIRLDPTYKMVRYIYASLIGAVIIFFAFLFVMVEPTIRNVTIPVFLLIILLVIWNIIYHGISFPYMGYAIREKDITYQSGWLWKS